MYSTYTGINICTVDLAMENTLKRWYILFIYFSLETTPFIAKGYVAKEKQKEKEGRSNKGNLGALCARLGGRSTPLRDRNEKKEREDQFSHLLHAPPPLWFLRLSTRPSWPRAPRPHTFHQPFILFYFVLETTLFIPKGYVAKEKKEGKEEAIRTKEIYRPPRYVVRMIRGQEYPLTKKSRNDKKREEQY